ncbi:MAG TPA: LON peptidase substrate-binding domain-containing protein [Alphaproteobacteria bacterium]|nr:LON peptidase substrate-binding domain-containing protein [Alphaproteobacteria bacterium]
MSGLPFQPVFERLPGTLPVFPLDGVLLLPRGRLPLNVFEPRYINMVQDVLATPERLIGIIQPSGAAGPGGGREPALYPVGCAGRISAFSETEDGRLVLTLTGVCRFQAGAELATTRGYRRVAADWSRFRDDMREEGDAGLDRARLLASLRAYFKRQGLQADWDAVASTPDERLVTTLAMVCPFAPQEKQALLEAPDLPERARALLTLLEIAAVDDGGGGESVRH